MTNVYTAFIPVHFAQNFPLVSYRDFLMMLNKTFRVTKTPCKFLLVHILLMPMDTACLSF